MATREQVLGSAGLLALKMILRPDGPDGRREVWRRIHGALAGLDRFPTIGEVGEVGIMEGYAGWARNYDSPANPFFLLQERSFFPVLRSMELAPGIVLDAGGGTGRISALLSQLPGGLVPLLMDRSPEMLGQARSSHPELRAIRAEFGRIPLPDQCTTAVVSSLALTHTDDLAAAIAEFGRTLRPDGRVLICDIHPSAVSLGWQAFFRHASGQDMFLRNVLFSMSEYFSAFTGADLEVTGLSEVFFDQESIRVMGERDPLAASVLAEAFDGLPALVIWEARPRSRRGARTAAPPPPGGHPDQGPGRRV